MSAHHQSRVTVVVFALLCLVAGGLGFLTARRPADTPNAQVALPECPRERPAPAGDDDPPAPEEPAPKLAPAVPEKPAAETDIEYAGLIEKLTEKIPGLRAVPRPLGPGRYLNSPRGEQVIVIAGTDPDAIVADLKKEARPEWQFYRSGPYVFAGHAGLIGQIKDALKPRAPALAGRPPAANPEPPGPPDAEVERLIGELRRDDVKAKVAAARELQKLGERGRPAAKALCVVAVDTRPTVFTAAIRALESVAPELHGPVKVLRVDNAEVNHRAAVQDLFQRGADARAAGPVLAAYVFSAAQSAPARLTDDSPAFAALAAYREVARDDPDACEPLQRAVRFFVNTPLAAVAYRHLGELGEAQPQLRARIAKTLLPALRSEINFLEVIRALGCQGPAARDALPELERVYDRHPAKEVRDAAGEAIRRIKDS